MTEYRRRAPANVLVWVVAAIALIAAVWWIFAGSTDPENRTPLESPRPTESGPQLTQPLETPEVTLEPVPSPT